MWAWIDRVERSFFKKILTSQVPGIVNIPSDFFPWSILKSSVKCAKCRPSSNNFWLLQAVRLLKWNSYTALKYSISFPKRQSVGAVLWDVKFLGNHQFARTWKREYHISHRPSGWARVRISDIHRECRRFDRQLCHFANKSTHWYQTNDPPALRSDYCKLVLKKNICTLFRKH